MNSISDRSSALERKHHSIRQVWSPVSDKKAVVKVGPDQDSDAADKYESRNNRLDVDRQAVKVSAFAAHSVSFFLREWSAENGHEGYQRQNANRRDCQSDELNDIRISHSHILPQQ